MSRAGEAQAAHAVRVLASPVFVFALVMLILNDHVLKQAWPGLVTGKLSDVAGLVVAPLLLAAPLAAMGVRRSVPTAIAMTGIGFVLAKTSVAGAAATSAVWSLTGVPTLIRADMTDLFALPALGLAWWVDRRVRHSPREPWRRAVAMATGMAILPIAVLATAATSCDEGMWITAVSRVKGDFSGLPRQVEQRLLIDVAGHASVFTMDATRGVELVYVERSAGDQVTFEQCDPSDLSQCWRIRDEGVVVEHSVDGGRTWQPELDLSDAELEAIRDDTDSCGGPGRIAASDLGVLPSDGEPVVVVPIGKGGAFIRGEDAGWELYSPHRLSELAAPSTSRTPPPEVTPLDQPSAVVTPQPSEDSTDEATPTCAHPSPTTVTPNPSNGPPTTYDVCP